MGITKSVAKNTGLSRDPSSQVPWSTEYSLHPELPRRVLKGHQLQQHQVGSPQKQRANALVQSTSARLASANLESTAPPCGHKPAILGESFLARSRPTLATPWTVAC